ncbi:MAG: cellobiose phosphorylase [Saccharofermentans sp.]|nr:cellobiose phosphorylase [Saccharofermentans sp.]
MNYSFKDSNGTFEMEDPSRYSYLYLPIASSSGVLSCITPNGGGDSRLDQDRYLLPPVVVEDLQESMVTRNFWLDIEGTGLRSAFGFSLSQLGKTEENTVEGGMLYQKITRIVEGRLKCEILSFAPEGKARSEVMRVNITNIGNEDIVFTPTAAIPVFARGADHIRDHRHVTSLLNVCYVKDIGVEVKPTMAFDERGHHRNEDVYAVYGRASDGSAPEEIFPTVVSFTGEGGNLLCPAGAKAAIPGMAAGSVVSGKEAFAGLKFKTVTLASLDSIAFNIVTSFGAEGYEYLDSANIDKAFKASSEYWNNAKVIHVGTGDKTFDGWMEWVSVQPQLRKLYGCSFLPYHDYGRGGRGWRDLWQDCLALLLKSPESVKEDLAGFFAGVRMDGSNATIIGSKPGEFIADRNGIARVWMDHGFWPMFTVNLYIGQTGDTDFLFIDKPYFKDRQILRGELTDESFDASSRPQEKTSEGEVYCGSILEHMLIQQLTQFFDCGANGNMRLRGADWNDALDMASVKGESVAFTAAYAGSMKILADLIARSGKEQIEIAEEILPLLSDMDYKDIEARRSALLSYERSVAYSVSGKKAKVSSKKVIDTLLNMSESIKEHINSNEIVGDGLGNKWFNGYYDNDGVKVEGMHEGNVRMMLTSQVFTLMFGIASEDMVRSVIASCDKYLYAPALGGYRLNTDFGEVKMNMGRAFGFAYGEKENGAVFCHMCVMYAYALYSRSHAREGYKVFKAMYDQSVLEGPDGGRMYPGIPEYFGGDGRGMYPYLTGAASWAVLLVLSKMYGVNFEGGKLKLMPSLVKEQFDSEGKASISFDRNKSHIRLTYINKDGKDFGDYKICEVSVSGKKADMSEGYIELPSEGDIEISAVLG